MSQGTGSKGGAGEQFYRDAFGTFCANDGTAFIAAGNGVLKGSSYLGVDVSDAGWNQNTQQYVANQVRIVLFAEAACFCCLAVNTAHP
jgi:hypothetical protein